MSKWRNGYDEIGFNSPDWAKAESVTFSSTPYTVTKDGWIAGIVTISGTINLFVNLIQVASFQGTSSYFENGPLFIKVSLGDEITANGTITTLKFIPHK